MAFITSDMAKKCDSKAKQLVNWLHLWLGLVSGIVVFIVCITGAIYVFQQDIKDVLEPWRFVDVQNTAFVPPSVLLDTANTYVSNHRATGLTYAGKTGAAAVGYEYKEHGIEHFTAIFMNPYTGAFIRAESTIGDGGFDFFRFIIQGHRSLWLPPEIGRPIVGYSTLIFVVLLLTGLVLWWPKKYKKAQLKRALKVKWTAKFKRLNYDLHNVLGFYVLLFALTLALTGLVISFQWFKTGVYYVASGGEKSYFEIPQSTPPPNRDGIYDIGKHMDLAWHKVRQQETQPIKGMYVSPDIHKPKAHIVILTYHGEDTYYDRNMYYFDKYSLQRLPTSQDRFKTADFADQLMMLNYDIHIGTAWGWIGKIIAFIASLIGASLPITGFLYWWYKPRKKKS